MKNAPFACPKCGAEKEWRCLTDPSQEENASRGKQALVSSLFGLLGLHLFNAFNKGQKLRYRCDKCGYQETYKPD